MQRSDSHNHQTANDWHASVYYNLPVAAAEDEVNIACHDDLARQLWRKTGTCKMDLFIWCVPVVIALEWRSRNPM